MILVTGSFRLPPERIAEARPAMIAVIAISRAEPGCLGYSYAEDVAEPGQFRVSEAWASREALEAHFATPHMKAWQQAREALGFHDRDVAVFSADGGEAL